MNYDEKLNVLKTRIEEFYGHALLRPQILCRPVEIETFVVAIESILDCLHGPGPRIDSYRAFLDESNYGATRFESAFERNNNCILSYSQIDQIQPYMLSLEDKFSAEFHDHWSKFLAWRRQRNRGKGESFD